MDLCKKKDGDEFKFQPSSLLSLSRKYPLKYMKPSLFSNPFNGGVSSTFRGKPVVPYSILTLQRMSML